MVLNGDSATDSHRSFTDLPALLEPGDRLVFNNTRVIPARLFGRKASGGKVEILLERLTGKEAALVKIRASKSPAAGQQLHIHSSTTDETVAVLEVVGRQDDLFQVQRADGDSIAEVFEGAGQFITLHVGAGTFQPVRVDDIGQHVMHAERYSLDESVVAEIEHTRASGGRIIAVGTTSVRTLESAAREALGSGERLLMPSHGIKDTRLFIKPGDPFHIVDGMITNFHLPESTLLMLVCAFAGMDQTLAAYREAVAQQYRFYSYGDAMLVWPDSQ